MSSCKQQEGWGLTADNSGESDLDGDLEGDLDGHKKGDLEWHLEGDLERDPKPTNIVFKRHQVT